MGGNSTKNQPANVPARVAFLVQFDNFLTTDGENPTATLVRYQGDKPLGGAHRERVPRFIRSMRQMSRSRNDQALTTRATERLVKVAQRRGLTKYRIMISREGGKPSYALVVDETAPPISNELDGWIEKKTNAG
jgi:hypothetical protein